MQPIVIIPILPDNYEYGSLIFFHLSNENYDTTIDSNFSSNLEERTIYYNDYNIIKIYTDYISINDININISEFNNNFRNIINKFFSKDC
jgi:hypothetical protein